VPFSPPPKLVTDGPYRFARNPMLTGIFIQLFGLGILGNSLALIIIFTPLFILMNYWEFKKVEEPELAKRLGQEYVDYKNRVPMFFLWRKKITGMNTKTSFRKSASPSGS
jgi:protein-S-isoprenylcysteine O-methyltransferase Ste14